MICSLFSSEVIQDYFNVIRKVSVTGDALMIFLSAEEAVNVNWVRVHFCRV